MTPCMWTVDSTWHNMFHVLSICVSPNHSHSQTYDVPCACHHMFHAMLYEQPVYRDSTGWQWLQLSLTNPDRSSFSIVLYPVILWYYIHCISQWIGLSIVETYYIMFVHGNISCLIFYLGHTSQLNKLKRHETLFWQTVQKEVNVITQILRREKLHLISHRTQFSLHFSLLPLLSLLPLASYVSCKIHSLLSQPLSHCSDSWKSNLAVTWSNQFLTEKISRTFFAQKIMIFSEKIWPWSFPVTPAQIFFEFAKHANFD